MFRRTRKVLLALSGGPDSVATLLVLRELGPQLGFEVEACHFDHQLRPESRDDTARVRAICEALGIECVTGEGDVRGVAKQMKRGIEDMAREMRYQFLAFVAEKEGCDAIATGHTRDDQAETVLMRVIRGSGVRGIRGMLPVSTVPGANARRLLRPMLETTRAATEAICREFGVEPVSDPSNNDITIRRNKVRHEVLPGLRMFNPSVADALVGLAASAREAFGPVEKASLEVQPRERGPIGAIFRSADLRALPAEGLGLVLEREASFYHLRPELNRTRLENLLAVLAKGTGQVRFGDTVVEASTGLVRLGPPLEGASDIPPAIVNVPGDTRAGDWVVRIRTDPLDGDANSPVAAVDATAVQGVLKLRSLATGDRIELRGVTRKVSDLLVNEKVPAWERPGIVVLADSAGVVALFGGRGTFVRDGAEPDLWVKLSAIAPR
jgi:tRNA(Ile)-lysidine synthase